MPWRDRTQAAPGRTLRRSRLARPEGPLLRRSRRDRENWGHGSRNRRAGRHTQPFCRRRPAYPSEPCCTASVAPSRQQGTRAPDTGSGNASASPPCREETWAAAACASIRRPRRLFFHISAGQVGGERKRRGVIGLLAAINLQILEHALDIDARLVERDALDPVDHADIAAARVAEGMQPLF